MTTPLTNRAGQYLGDALRGVRQAPVELIAVIIVAATFSWALESDRGNPAFRTWLEIAVPSALLLVGAWTGTMLHAMGRWNSSRRWAFTGAVAIAVVIYAWTTADFRFEAEIWRAGLLLAAAVVWLVALPAFGGFEPGARRTERMRAVDGRFALRVIGAILYGAALFIGLALALAAIDTLFELQLKEEIYQHVWAWIAFVLIPLIVIGGLEDYARAASAGPTSSGVASVAYRIALWLLPPLLALYTLILYAYVARIVVTGEIPKNLVSPMVLAAGALAALALLLFNPRPGDRGLARALRVAPALFIPLAPLGYWALLARIDQYGWTEFRVVRVVVLSALVALAIAATIQLARRRAFSLHMVPLVLAAVLLLSAIGPWSAMAISRGSQEGRLETALRQVGIASEAAVPRPEASRVVPAAAYEQIRESARYLAGHFGQDGLPAALAGFAGEDAARVDYAARLGLRPDAPPRRDGLSIGGKLSRGQPLEIMGGTAYRVSWTRGPRGEDRPEGAVTTSADSSPIRVLLRDGRRIDLSVNGRVLSAELSPLMRELERLADPRGPDQLPSQHALLPLADAAGVHAGDLVVWDLRAVADSAGWRLQRMEGLAVLNRAISQR